jgi:hypothetical protein
MFKASVHVDLGNGTSCLFWEDRWINGDSVDMITPTLVDFVDPKIRKSRTVAEGLSNHAWVGDLSGGLSVVVLAQFLQLWNVIANIDLHVDREDSFS